MFDIVIRRNDTLPVISKTVSVDGVVLNLNGYTAEFVVETVTGVEILRRTAVVDTNTVSYSWTTDDSNAVVDDVVFAHFEGTKDGDVMTIPNSRPLSMLLATSSAYEYSYSGDPSARPIDEMRFLLDDTNLDTALFTDKQLEYLYAKFGNVYSASAEAAFIQSGTFTNIADKTVGPLSISYKSVSSRWVELALSLRQRGVRNSGAKAIMTQSSTEHLFKIGMHDQVVGPDAYDY